MGKTQPPRTRTRAQPLVSGLDGRNGEATPHHTSKVDGCDDYEVGYKKPPGHTQFKPGQSGNPKGRPKGRKNLKTDLAEELQERISVREGGALRTMSKQKAMLKCLTTKALKGDTRATTVVLNLILQLLGQDEEDGPVDLKAEDQAILEDFERRLEERAIQRVEKKHGSKKTKV